MTDYFAGYEIDAQPPNFLVICEDDVGARLRAQSIAIPPCGRSLNGSTRTVLGQNALPHVLPMPTSPLEEGHGSA